MLQLEIITPEKEVFNENIDELVVTTTTGQIAILPNHIPLFTQIVLDEVIIKTKGKEHYLAVTGGFLEVQKNKVTILADYAVRSDEIEVKKALEAQQRAEELLKKKGEGISEQDLALAQGELRKSLLQIKVVNRRRHPKNPVQ